MSLLLNDSAASFGWGASAPRHIFLPLIRNKRLSIKEGDKVEYVYEGKAYQASVAAVMWLGSMKARIIPAVKGHPTTLPVKALKLIKEQ